MYLITQTYDGKYITDVVDDNLDYAADKKLSKLDFMIKP